MTSYPNQFLYMSDANGCPRDHRERARPVQTWEVAVGLSLAADGSRTSREHGVRRPAGADASRTCGRTPVQASIEPNIDGWNANPQRHHRPLHHGSRRTLRSIRLVRSPPETYDDAERDQRASRSSPASGHVYGSARRRSGLAGGVRWFSFIRWYTRRRLISRELPPASPPRRWGIRRHRHCTSKRGVRQPSYVGSTGGRGAHQFRPTRRHGQHRLPDRRGVGSWRHVCHREVRHWAGIVHDPAGPVGQRRYRDRPTRSGCADRRNGRPRRRTTPAPGARRQQPWWRPFAPPHKSRTMKFNVLLLGASGGVTHPFRVGSRTSRSIRQVGVRRICRWKALCPTVNVVWQRRDRVIAACRLKIARTAPRRRRTHVSRHRSRTPKAAICGGCHLPIVAGDPCLYGCGVNVFDSADETSGPVLSYGYPSLCSKWTTSNVRPRRPSPLAPLESPLLHAPRSGPTRSWHREEPADLRIFGIATPTWGPSRRAPATSWRVGDLRTRRPGSRSSSTPAPAHREVQPHRPRHRLDRRRRCSSPDRRWVSSAGGTFGPSAALSYAEP